MSLDDLHELLSNYININQFNSAKEANIAWLEEMEGYNIWTHFTLGENKIVFDINSFSERRLSEQGVSAIDAMDKCAHFLERKMKNVL